MELKAIEDMFEELVRKVEEELRIRDKPGIKVAVIPIYRCDEVTKIKVIDGDADVVAHELINDKLKVILSLRDWARTPKGKKYVRLHVTCRIKSSSYPDMYRPVIHPEDVRPYEVPKELIEELVDRVVSKLKNVVNGLGYDLRVSWEVVRK